MAVVCYFKDVNVENKRIRILNVPPFAEWQARVPYRATQSPR